MSPMAELSNGSAFSPTGVTPRPTIGVNKLRNDGITIEPTQEAP